MRLPDPFNRFPARKRGFALSLLLALFVPMLGLQAETLSTGTTLSDLKFKDQYDREHMLTGKLRYLVFAGDMQGGKIIHAWMKDRTDDYLTSENIALVADIHRMPYLIARTIALPRMRGYSYSLFLINDDTRGAVYPSRPDTVTILILKDLTVQDIQYAGNHEELQKIIDRFR